MNLDIFLYALTSYFVIIDPIGTAVVFYGLTSGADQSYRYRMAIRAVVISTIIVLCFGFFGEHILTNLGISIASLRVAGGLLLFYTAFGMITRQQVDTERTDLQVDISVYPLSIPLIAGPGCLTLNHSSLCRTICSQPDNGTGSVCFDQLPGRSCRHAHVPTYPSPVRPYRR